MEILHCETSSHESTTKKHPDHGSDLLRLRKARGQIEGIERMVLADRYCPEILIQIQAVTSALKKVEKRILERHLRGCVREAIESKSKSKVNEKIDELMNLWSGT